MRPHHETALDDFVSDVRQKQTSDAAIHAGSVGRGTERAD